jgi:hypothetical protein
MYKDDVLQPATKGVPLVRLGWAEVGWCYIF